MNAGADRPVLIYQMGKVASSALCAALNDAGIAAAQTHFLGNAALTAILQRLLNPALADHFTHHLQGQLELNTRLTRHLLRARQAVEQASEGADKIKLISLTREPLNWYLAEFIQNFDGYMPALRAFCGRAADDHRDDSACILEAHHAMLATLARLRLPPNMRTHADIAGILKPALSDAHQEALLPNARNLFKPILWFQRLFAEPTGIDVFAQEPQTVAQGALRFESACCDALVIRYEDLHVALPAVARFVGLPSLTLPRTNLSSDKRQFALARDTLTQLEIPESLARALYGSDYCRLFGYPERRTFGQVSAG